MSGTNWAASSGTAGQHRRLHRLYHRQFGDFDSSGALNVAPSGVQTPVTTADTFNSLNLAGTVGVTMSGGGALTLVKRRHSSATRAARSAAALWRLVRRRPDRDYAAESHDRQRDRQQRRTHRTDQGWVRHAGPAGKQQLQRHDHDRRRRPADWQRRRQRQLGARTGARQRWLALDLGGTSSIPGAISGNGSLAKTGSGRIVLGGANSFLGGTTIGQGALQLANSAALLNSTVAINADNGLQFSPAVGTFYLGGLSGGNLLQLSDTRGIAIGVVIGSNGRLDYLQRSDRRQRLSDKDGAVLLLSGSESYTGGTRSPAVL